MVNWNCLKFIDEYILTISLSILMNSWVIHIFPFRLCVLYFRKPRYYILRCFSWLVCVCVFFIVWCVDDDDDESLYRAWWESYKQQHGKRRWEKNKKQKNKKKKLVFSQREMFSFLSPQLRAVVVYTLHPSLWWISPPSKQLQKNNTHTKNIEYRNDNLSLYIAHPSRFSSSSFSTVEMRNSLLTSYMSIISGVNRIKWRARQETRIIIFFFFFESGKFANWKKCALYTKREKFPSQWHTHTHRSVIRKILCVRVCCVDSCATCGTHGK